MYSFTYDKEVIYFNYSPGDHISANWKRGIFYEDRLLQKIRSFNLGGVYVDLGGHHGNHSIYFDKFCNSDKVISVEGNPYNFKFLKENTIKNNCKTVLYNEIVSDTQGIELTMEYDMINTGSSYVVCDNDINKSIKGNIQTTNITNTLNNLLKNEDNITLIKMDIENYEYNALLGAQDIIDKYHPIIVIELHKVNPYYNEILEFFDKNNYKTDNINYACSPTFIYM